MRRDGLPETVNEFDSLLDRFRGLPLVDEQVDELYAAVQEDRDVPGATAELIRLAFSDN